jgi:hypothetical protein
MNSTESSSTQPLDDAAPTAALALQGAVAGLLSSVAELAVARGLPFEAVEEALKMAFVQAASRAHPGLAEHRKVSRISTTTGINRREVTRLTQLAAARQQAGQPAITPRSAPSLASEVFTHWRSEPAYLDTDGHPLVLPRLGPAPSFEALAQGVTRDVHPRGLLDELCRLGLARWDSTQDTVRAVPEPLVPKGDQVRLLGFLGDNVGDHLRAAVANVLGDSSLHFEQAVFADGLSTEAIAAMRPAIAAQWQAMLQAMVPALQAHVQAGEQLQPAPTGRLRVGLYSYHETGSTASGHGVASTNSGPKLPRRVAGIRRRPAGPLQPAPKAGDGEPSG